jgi:hypothetical protein
MPADALLMTIAVVTRRLHGGIGLGGPSNETQPAQIDSNSLQALKRLWSERRGDDIASASSIRNSASRRSRCCTLWLHHLDGWRRHFSALV